MPRISLPKSSCFSGLPYMVWRIRHKYSSLLSFRIKLNPYTNKITLFDNLSCTIIMSLSLFCIPLNEELEVATLYILLNHTQNFV